MHPPVGPAWLVWLELSGLSEAMRRSAWMYPIVEIVHIVGFVVLVGAAVMFDLRVLGLAKGISPATLHATLRWGLVGFAASVITGVMFISGAPEQYFYNDAFKVKVVCLLLLGLNVVAFYSVEARKVLALGPVDQASRRASAFSIRWSGTSHISATAT